MLDIIKKNNYIISINNKTFFFKK